MRASAISACILAAFSVAPAGADEWSFRIAPYGWFAGLEGRSAPFPGGPTAEIDLSFSEVLEDLDIAAFIAAEARKGDLFIRTDLTFAATSTSAPPPSADFSRADVTSRTLQFSAVGGWTFYRDDQLRADAFAGGRLWRISTELDLAARTLPSTTFSNTETFVNPIIGLSGGWQVAPDWSVGASASVGGFGAAADIEYGGVATVFWQGGEHWGLEAGYRYISVDYERNGFVFDIEQHGPILGAFFEF